MIGHLVGLDQQRLRRRGPAYPFEPGTVAIDKANTVHWDAGRKRGAAAGAGRMGPVKTIQVDENGKPKAPPPAPWGGVKKYGDSTLSPQRAPEETLRKPGDLCVLCVKRNLCRVKNLSERTAMNQH